MVRPAASALPCHQPAWVATTCPAPSNRSDRRGQSASISSSSISQILGKILAGTGPPVVEQHRLAAVERRSHQTRPVRTEFGGDQIDELGIGRCLRGGYRVVQPGDCISRAADASTPSRPVTCSANSPSAAESTISPAPPPVGGVIPLHPGALPPPPARQYRRIAARRGPLRANVAVQRALLVAIWNIATADTGYHDPGGDYFTRLNPQKARNNAVRQLEALGSHVTLDQAS